MVYYNHAFYSYLTSSYRVTLTRSAVIIRNRRDGESEEVAYANMDIMDSRALLKYIGERVERLLESLGGNPI